MKNFLKKVIEGNGISPSQVCLKSFDDNFSEAVNVEWFNREGGYEASFYRHNREHLAVFSLNGVLLEYRQDLTPEHLPGSVRNLSLSMGEIMNAVLRNRGNMLEYEIIIKDTASHRHLVLITDVGELIEDKIL